MHVISGQAEDLVFVAKRLLLGPYRVRRTQLYCVGAGKSGTHSIAAMFAGNVRSRHEPEAAQLIDKILDRHSGRIGDPELTQWLRARDRRLALEVDASLLNFDILDLLLREFPDARFVLTIRDCYSWLNSVINHIARVRDTIGTRWIRIWDLRFRPDQAIHAPEEQALKEKGLSNLESYFSYWTARHEQVLAKVPAPRLFVVRTDQIRQRAFDLADFAGLPRRAVRLDRTREFSNPDPQDFLRKIERRFLEQKVEQHCRPLMIRFFPEIRSLDDATL